MVEGTPLLRVQAPKGPRGFESHPARHGPPEFVSAVLTGTQAPEKERVFPGFPFHQRRKAAPSGGMGRASGRPSLAVRCEVSFPGNREKNQGRSTIFALYEAEFDAAGWNPQSLQSLALTEADILANAEQGIFAA